MAVRVLRIFENREHQDPDSDLIDVLVGNVRPRYLVTIFCNEELVVRRYRHIRTERGWLRRHDMDCLEVQKLKIEKRLSNWEDT